MPSIDQNSRQVGLGYVHESPRTTLECAITASDKLLIEIIPVADIGTLNANVANIPIDENTRQVAAGISDDANETIIPLTTDSIGEFPLIRVELL